ncbi:very short patch repair endonuclease [Nocardioides piscis]|uniref:Very short patch repair endonuclease n=1 Tax=Nocardioides piscis TaxID=2714938 RepID=A0A6G7YBT5_9ACTN|nr:very short patch repair endonuclease [Nocardioides piscis]QIK74111.1 very short patch repair endonuclease [Nocardioides piscis]
MRANKGSDTKPELALRSELHRRGLRFRKDFRLVLGGVRLRPDVAFTRTKVAVFVDGCFWHSCPDHRTTPKANAEFWSAKLMQNQNRDRLQDQALKDAGWTVVRAWEHEDPAVVADQIETLVRSPDA